MAEHVIVRFKDAVGVPYQDGVWNQLSRLIGPRWDAITREFGMLPISRVFREGPPAPAKAKRAVANDRPEPYFDVELPDLQSARNFIQRLRQLRDIVVDVYPRGEATLAKRQTGTPTGTMGVSDGQGYLRPGPHGIDAVAAWNLHQAHGEGVTIADMERGWYLEHRELPRDIPVVSGENASNKDHGVAVMGILVALHTQSEVKGGAPRARTMAISYAKSAAEQLDRAPIIRDARKWLAPGDILLLEFGEPFDDEERGIHIAQAPAESKPHIKGAIRACTDAGILVIEPAGNSGQDLTPLGLDEHHSGALIVGAAVHDGNGTHRWEAKGYTCNYGSRVNCFAWGHDIHTLGNPPDGYQVTNSTSGASAIIAVAAALLQSVARRRLKALGRERAYLNPEELLTYLSDPECGTLTENHANYPIGVMPSLGRVIDRFFKKNPLPARARPVPIKRNQTARLARAQATKTARPARAKRKI